MFDAGKDKSVSDVHPPPPVRMNCGYRPRILNDVGTHGEGRHAGCHGLRTRLPVGKAGQTNP